jgi:hypothetical protein
MWGGGAGLPLRPHCRHGRLHGQGTLVHGHQGQVPDVPSLAEEVAACTSGRSTKKLKRGTSGARQAPPKRHTGKGTQQQRQQQPRGQQQQRNMDHRRFVIERLNLELEVARTNVGARTNGTSYANVVRGAFKSPPPPPLPLPPPPPRPLPLPQQPAPEDDLERRQAVNRLFTLYESQHVQMMEIKDLLRK